MALFDTLSTNDNLSDQKQSCIEDCLETAETSEWCADECLGSEDMEQCARLCRDVADLTALHARLMARGSDCSGYLAEACADVCQACADECSQHDADHCQINAEVLEQCAESCQNMA